MADNPEGKATTDPRPFSVDYQNGEAVIGRAITVPKFRRLHLRSYNGYIWRKYCREKGINRIISSVDAHNFAALAVAREAPDRYIKSKYRLIRILWYTHLKETKTDHVTTRQVVKHMTKGKEKN